MTRLVHLYPFAASRRDGGSLRLRRAVSAAPADVWTFVEGRWSVTSREQIATELNGSGVPSADTPRRLQRLKRALFPSTLWESGRRPQEAAGPILDRIEAGDTVVLHTTYLLPLADKLLDTGAKVIVDAYDLVWRAQAIDAHGLAAPLRATYAITVRAREMPLLARVHAVAVAGYGDWLRIRRHMPLSQWIPTGLTLPAERHPSRISGGMPRIGFLGNFAHRPTRDSGDALMTAAAVIRHEARVVIAGAGSEAWARGRHVDVLGSVEEPADLYDQVDVVVAPVVSGAGIKVKLAEAILFGKPTVTTPLGLDGFSPQLRQHLEAVRDPREISASLLRKYLSLFDARVARTDFSSALSADRVETQYRDLFNRVG